MNSNAATATNDGTESKTQDLQMVVSDRPWSLELLLEEFAAPTAEEMAKLGEEMPEISEGEVVIGQVPDSAKAIFIRAGKYHNLELVLMKEIKTDVDKVVESLDDDFDPMQMAKSVHDKFYSEIHRADEYKDKVSLLSSLAWIMINDELGRSCKSQLSIRKGWQVVQEVPKPSGILFCVLLRWRSQIRLAIVAPDSPKEERQ